jgi:phenylacetate-CoA ligase
MWNREAESLPRRELEQLQLERLRSLVERVHRAVPFYQERLEAARVDAESIRSLRDLPRLPFTTKADLREQYPFGFFAAPREEIVRVHASSGTTGKPTVVGYTRCDLTIWSEVLARTFTAATVTRTDVVHNAYGYGLFTGGLGIGLGAETIGAMTVPISGGLTKRQLMLMEDFGATVLASTPSYALVLADTARELGIDVRKQLKLRVALLGAEPFSEATRREIETRLGVESFDIYGLSEIIGPGVAVDCQEHDSLHIFEDHFLPEVIDPDTGEPRDPGTEGELVLTTLTKTGMPLLRYRTRDRATLDLEPCRCGRTLVRMSRVLGRTDDMLILRGVNVFPSQIEHALLETDGLTPHFLIIVDRNGERLDGLEVWVEPTDDARRRGDDALNALGERAREHLHQRLGIRLQLRIVAPGRVPRSEGKVVRVRDRRSIESLPA